MGVWDGPGSVQAFGPGYSRSLQASRPADRPVGDRVEDSPRRIPNPDENRNSQRIQPSRRVQEGRGQCRILARAGKPIGTGRIGPDSTRGKLWLHLRAPSAGDKSRESRCAPTTWDKEPY